MAVFPFQSSDIETCDWTPNVDVYKTSTGWALKFELPGVQTEDVTIEITKSVVRVHGMRRDLVVERHWRHYSMEISYCGFDRSVELPARLEGASIRKTSIEGMLIISIDVRKEEAT
jgi:HSP20 family protein